MESLKEASDIFLELNQPDNKSAFSDSVFSSYEKINEIRDGINKFHRLSTLEVESLLFEQEYCVIVQDLEIQKAEQFYIVRLAG